MSSEEMGWIYSQIFKEILCDIKEDERSKVKEYCKDLYTDENTFDYIATQRGLLEEYDSLRETTRDSNPYISLANLLSDKKDYDRAEHFYSEGLQLENQNWSNQVKILNKLSHVAINKNQRDKAKQYYEQANQIQKQHS